MPLSKSTIDNEKRKFKEDPSGEVAVNICGEQLVDITDAINATTNVTKTTPTVYNVAITAANTEFSQALSANTKGLTLRTRGKADLQIAFTSGQTNTNYMTLKRGAVFSEEGMNATGLTVYFESSQSSITVEIIEWT